MKTRIALIGAGFISDYHARGLQTLADVEIVAVVSKNLDNAQKFALKYKIKEALNDISSLVKRDDLDAVIISTPNQFHAPYAIAFLQNGKDVFLEKPMGMSGNEGRQIAEVAKKHNQLVMVGHMWRFDTDTRYIKDTVDSGTIGALADMGVHAIDAVRYILGDPKPTKVYARISTEFGAYDVDDTAILVITWNNGTESIIESGWWHPHMDGPEASTSLFGTKGYANLFPTFLKMKEGEGTVTTVPELPAREDHCDQIIYTRQMEYFVDCIKTRTEPVPGLEEGQMVLDIVDAAYKSAKTGEVVNLF
mgnify:CR=1 FL=1